MNPYELKNHKRLREILYVFQNALETHDHNKIIEKEIVEKGDPFGKLNEKYRMPNYMINNLLLIAQISDMDNGPLEQETYHIKEGGVVLFQGDGEKTDLEIPAITSW